MIAADNKTLKLCDFGSVVAFSDHESQKFDELGSRYYRAPEVILGCYPLDSAVDVWSAAVTLYELYTGKYMFPGKSNNHVL